MQSLEKTGHVLHCMPCDKGRNGACMHGETDGRTEASMQRAADQSMQSPGHFHAFALHCMHASVSQVGRGGTSAEGNKSAAHTIGADSRNIRTARRRCARSPLPPAPACLHAWKAPSAGAGWPGRRTRRPELLSEANRGTAEQGTNERTNERKEIKSWRFGRLPGRANGRCVRGAVPCSASADSRLWPLPSVRLWACTGGAAQSRAGGRQLVT